jgi:hypothetical protein
VGKLGRCYPRLPRQVHYWGGVAGAPEHKGWEGGGGVMQGRLGSVAN